MRALVVILVLCSSLSPAQPVALQPALQPVQLKDLVGLKFAWGYAPNGNSVVRTRSWGDLTISVRSKGAGVVGLVIKDGDRHDLAWQGMWKSGTYVAIIENDRSDSTICLEGKQCAPSEFVAITALGADRSLYTRALARLAKRPDENGVVYFDVPPPKEGAPVASEIWFSPGGQQLADRLANKLRRTLGAISPKEMPSPGSPYRVQVLVGSTALPHGEKRYPILRDLAPPTDDAISKFLLEHPVWINGLANGECAFARDQTFSCNHGKTTGVWAISQGVVKLRAGEDREAAFIKNGRASFTINQLSANAFITQGTEVVICRERCTMTGNTAWGLRAGKTDQALLESIYSPNATWVELGPGAGVEPRVICRNCSEGYRVPEFLLTNFGVETCVAGEVPGYLGCILELPPEGFVEPLPVATPTAPSAPTRVKLIDGACAKPPCTNATFERLANQLSDATRYALEKGSPAKNQRASTEVWFSPGKKALADAVARELFGARAPESKEWTFGGTQDVVIITGP